MRQRLPFPHWLSLSYWRQGGIPSFWSRSPEYQPRSGCVPSSLYTPLCQHCNPCHRGTRGACSGWKNNKRSKSPGWLLTEIQATSNVPSVPSPSVASLPLFKHTFCTETFSPSQLITFPSFCNPCPVAEGCYWAGEALMGSWHIPGHLLWQSVLPQRSGLLIRCLCKSPP